MFNFLSCGFCSSCYGIVILLASSVCPLGRGWGFCKLSSRWTFFVFGQGASFFGGSIVLLLTVVQQLAAVLVLFLEEMSAHPSLCILEPEARRMPILRERISLKNSVKRIECFQFLFKWFRNCVCACVCVCMCMPVKKGIGKGKRAKTKVDLG